MSHFSAAKIICEGKTKQIWTGDDPYSVVIVSKDRITAGDGTRSDDLIGKAKISNATTCKIFTFLQNAGYIIFRHFSFGFQDLTNSFLQMIFTSDGWIYLTLLFKFIGLKTHFVSLKDDVSFFARRCYMVLFKLVLYRSHTIQSNIFSSSFIHSIELM